MKKALLTLLFLSGLTTASLAQKNDTITTASGLKYYFVQKGNGPLFKPGWIAIQHYILTLEANGTKIDDTRERNSPFVTQYPGNLIKGSNEAIQLMHVGDRAIFIMPGNIAYGPKGRAPIPPNATLRFDIELIDMKEKSVEMVLDSVLWGKPVRTDSIPHTAETFKAFAKLKKEKFGDLYISEDALNDIGYGLIKKHPIDAVQFFELNVKMYPKSWNVFDSLAEGYADIGETKKAIKYYEKSLKLNPKSQSGIDALKKLKAAKK